MGMYHGEGIAVATHPQSDQVLSGADCGFHRYVLSLVEAGRHMAAQDRAKCHANDHPNNGQQPSGWRDRCFVAVADFKRSK